MQAHDNKQKKKEKKKWKDLVFCYSKLHTKLIILH